MTTNIFSIVSFVPEFPARLYQLSDCAWTAETIAAPLSAWVCVDDVRGVYEMDSSMVCEPHLFVMDDRGLWDMSDEEVGEYAV